MTAAESWNMRTIDISKGKVRMTHYVYQRANGENFYVVGFFDPTGKWHAESDQDTREEAAARVHWLNGGNPTQAQRTACEHDPIKDDHHRFERGTAWTCRKCGKLVE
jgi:hypothetical protein